MKTSNAVEVAVWDVVTDAKVEDRASTEGVCQERWLAATKATDCNLQPCSLCTEGDTGSKHSTGGGTGSRSQSRMTDSETIVNTKRKVVVTVRVVSEGGKLVSTPDDVGY
ncbi:hypothetical protein P3T76_005542 [Phytophthora citrophthora]|uniref:Uncharacterized protein n=1 Tax=Phytophthora citrophthora TaxID=4793 RepID=A0AAD9LMX6_9STRA|nr:hypothetical protein P3T76_005542 [Phytophthora citrophthora]